MELFPPSSLISLLIALIALWVAVRRRQQPELRRIPEPPPVPPRPIPDDIEEEEEEEEEDESLVFHNGTLLVDGGDYDDLEEPEGEPDTIVFHFTIRPRDIVQLVASNGRDSFQASSTFPIDTPLELHRGPGGSIGRITQAGTIEATFGPSVEPEPDLIVSREGGRDTLEINQIMHVEGIHYRVVELAHTLDESGHRIVATLRSISEDDLQQVRDHAPVRASWGRSSRPSDDEEATPEPKEPMTSWARLLDGPDIDGSGVN